MLTCPVAQAYIGVGFFS